MQREIESELVSWKKRPDRLPLIIRGARQVGKTYLVEQFASQFENFIEINFELEPEAAGCFSSLDPTHIVNKIQAITGKTITPGKTLLFLDEIQECPPAIQAFRYFKEKLPELHVIGAGSLLEFTLNQPDFRVPVGRVQYLYLKPLSFREFLLAKNHEHLISALQAASLSKPIDKVLHNKLLALVKEYMVLGGMPQIIQSYQVNHDLKVCQNLQSSILNTYRNDFGKYASHTNHKFLRKLFDKAPFLIAQDFKYVKVDDTIKSRDLKQALENLQDAGLIIPVYSTSASGLPLSALINEKKFKILFLDVGLVKRVTRLDAELLMAEDLLLVNQGNLAEQFVGQELLAYADCYDAPELYFWARETKSSTAEIDYVIHHGSKIIPIEVKAGVTGRLKSIQIFLEEKKSPLGIRISGRALALNKNVLSIPLYMISETTRLLNEML